MSSGTTAAQSAANRPARNEGSAGARARSRAYGLLADLVGDGPRGAARDAARASPLLANACARYPRSDDLEADHEEAFGFQVFPLAGVFLDAEGRAGADPDGLAETCAELGLADLGWNQGFDHLATVLRALAVAGAAEADPAPRGVSLRAHSRTLLEKHLFTWLPAWASAVRRLELPWPTALADQVVELALFHCAELEAADPAELRETAAIPAREPPALPDLDDPATDLSAIARALTQAARAGLFLSRRDLTRLAQRSRTPIGFGPRAQLLSTALREGAHLDTLSPLLGELATLYRAWLRELAELERAAPRRIGALLTPWQQRAGEVLPWLDRVARAASGARA